MHTTSLLLALFGSTALCAAVTTEAVSQISDGQVQASASTSAPYTNPFTSYTTETNSVGIITGMPSVATSMPAVVTSMPAVVTSQPSVFMWNTTSTLSSETLAAANTSVPTTMLTGTAASASSSTGTGTSSASATLASSTGGAVANTVGGAGIRLGAVAMMAVFFF